MPQQIQAPGNKVDLAGNPAKDWDWGAVFQYEAKK